MDDLFRCIRPLSDDVVTSIGKGLDDFQLVVEWVVGAKTHILVGVSLFPVNLNVHPPVILL